MKRWWWHLLLVVVATLSVVMVAAEPASAAVRTASGQPGPFSWLSAKDSNGVSIWSYGTLPISGGGVTSPMKMIWSYTASLAWLAYLAVVMFGTFALYLVTSFAWLAPVADIFDSLADSFRDVVTQFGLVPTLLTATACVGGLLVLRGRWAAGIWEIAAAIVISVVGMSLLANPIGWVAGPDGVLKQANQAGLEIAADLGTDTKASGPDLKDVQTAQATKIVDTFVSSPAQMVSFGKVLSPSCESVMAEKMKAGEDADDVRDAVGDCDEKAGDYADNPGPMGVMTLLFVMPTGFLFVVLITVLCAGVFASSLWALWCGLKIIWNSVVALLPFGARGPLFQSIADVFVAGVLVGLSSIFMGGFLLVVDGVFTDRSKAGWPPMASFILVDFLIVGGVVVWLRQRAQLKAASSKVANAMAWRPSGSPGGTGVAGAAAAGAGIGFGRMAHSAARLGHAAAMVSSRGGGAAAAPSESANAAAAVVSTPLPTPQLALPSGQGGTSQPGSADVPPGAGPVPGSGGRPPALPAGKSSGKGDLARRAAIVGTQVAAAAATGGTSAAVQAAGQAAGQVAASQGAAIAARAARPPMKELPAANSTRPAGSGSGPAAAAAPAPGLAADASTPSRPTSAAPPPSARSSSTSPAGGTPPGRAADRPGRALGSPDGAAERPKWTRVVTDSGQVVYQPVED